MNRSSLLLAILLLLFGIATAQAQDLIKQSDWENLKPDQKLFYTRGIVDAQFLIGAELTSWIDQLYFAGLPQSWIDKMNRRVAELFSIYKERVGEKELREIVQFVDQYEKIDVSIPLLINEYFIQHLK